MFSASGVLGTLAGCRYSRQIVSIAPGATVANAAGATSIDVPWPSAGSVAANVRNYLIVALKPGAANGGAVATPSGWTLVSDHIGGGYGATLGAGVGNSRVYFFVKDNDNTATGTLTVSVTPDGANGVACANIGRIEKLKGSWRPIVASKAEATANVLAGVFALSPGMQVSPGDVVIYGFALAPAIVSGSSLSAGAGLTTMSPPLAATGPSSNVGYNLTQVSTGRRAQRGFTMGSQTLTIPNGDCRGPLIVARMRVR